MTLDQYVARFIDGYLFGDLHTMAAIRVQDDKQEFGAVGYPMVLTVLAGIELLGTLTSAAPFNRRQGEDRFCEFWRDHLYPAHPDRQALAVLIYQMVRNGLAHTYMTKPKFVVTRGHRGDHFTQTPDGQIVIDALALHDELVSAYKQRVKPLLAGAGRSVIETRFKEMRAWHAAEYVRFSSVFATVPMGRVPAKRGSLIAPDSPALPPAHSTQYTSSFPEEDS